MTWGSWPPYRPAQHAHEWMAASYISHRPPPPPPSAASRYSGVARRGAAGVDPMTNRQPASQSGGVRPCHTYVRIAQQRGTDSMRGISRPVHKKAAGFSLRDLWLTGLYTNARGDYSDDEKWGCCVLKICVWLAFLEDKKKIISRGVANKNKINNTVVVFKLQYSTITSPLW